MFPCLLIIRDCCIVINKVTLYITCSMVQRFLYVFPLEAQTGSTTSMQALLQEQLGCLCWLTTH